MQPIKSAKCSEQNTCSLLHSDEISSAKSRPELLQNEARCKITACNNTVLFISVRLLVVQFFLHKTGRRLAETRSKNQLAQLVVDENENEERPRRKPPRPPEHSNQLHWQLQSNGKTNCPHIADTDETRLCADRTELATSQDCRRRRISKLNMFIVFCAVLSRLEMRCELSFVLSRPGFQFATAQSQIYWGLLKNCLDLSTVQFT